MGVSCLKKTCITVKCLRVNTKHKSIIHPSFIRRPSVIHPSSIHHPSFIHHPCVYRAGGRTAGGRAAFLYIESNILSDWFDWLVIEAQWWAGGRAGRTDSNCAQKVKTNVGNKQSNMGGSSLRKLGCHSTVLGGQHNKQRWETSNLIF